jgi:outer membrane lipoprotein-sorting protein
LSVLLGAMLALSACVEVQMPPTHPRDIPNFAEDRSQDLTSALAQRANSLNSLQTDAVMSYSAGGRSLKTHEELVIQRPDGLKVEARSAFGVELILAARNGDLQIFDPSQNRFMTGTANAETLDKYVRIPMMPKDAVNLLLGLAPTGFDLNDPTAKLSNEGAMTVVTYTSPDGTTHALGFEDRNLVMVREAAPGGTIRYRVDYSDYHDIGGVMFPYRVAAEFPQSQSQVSFHYRRPIINGQIPSSTFVLTPAPGATETHIGMLILPSQRNHEG